MAKSYSKEFVIKVGQACLGQSVLLDGVLVRLVIGEGSEFQPCDACVFQGHCSRDTCDFCCMCDGSDVNNWVYFVKA